MTNPDHPLSTASASKSLIHLVGRLIFLFGHFDLLWWRG
jgi:hypothetical protein